MKRIIPFLLLLCFTSCDELMPLVDAYNTSITEPTENEIISGLKEALSVGITNAVKQTSHKNGFYGNSLIKIPLPAEVTKIDEALKKTSVT